MEIKANIFQDLEKIARLNPSPFYWLDLDQRYLGVNEHCIKILGATSYEKDFAGKTPYDLFPKEMANNVVQHHKQVIKTGKSLSAEETIRDEKGETRYFCASIAPLHNDNGKIIGTIGVSVDITVEQKEREHQKKVKIFEHLERIASFIPVNIYWVDVNDVILGGNELALKAIGGVSSDDFIGKTPHEYFSKDIADNIVKNLDEVRRTGNVLSKEETIKDLTTGKEKHFNAVLAPIRDDYGEVIGVIGISIDITARKEAAHLVLENERQRVEIMEQQKFSSIAAQVFHDIRSPLASITMTANSCKSLLPENTRITLLSAVTSVETIANDLLSEYHKKGQEEHGKKEERESILISLTLLELLTDKRHQYKDLPIKFEHAFSDNSHFVFTKAKPSAFKRMISNLVNNAVDAFEGKEGKVVLKLISDDIQAKIIIEDNGKGIPKDVLHKIKNNIAVTSGKKEGHGIGLEQVRDTLQENAGEIAIESKEGKGTKITLTFPVIPTPKWLAKEINLSKGDTIVILDDDPSIHNAWEMRFKDYTGMVTLKHFLPDFIL